MGSAVVFRHSVDGVTVGCQFADDRSLGHHD